MSNLFKINTRDFLRGLVSAVFVGVVVALAGVVQNGFDIFTANWIEIFKNMVNGGFMAFVCYLGTQFLSDHNNNVLGRL